MAWTPLVAAEATGLEDALVGRDSGGVSGTQCLETEGINFYLTINVQLLEERDSGSDAVVVSADYGGGIPFDFFGYPCIELHTGPSMLFLDHHVDDLSMFAVGWYVRCRWILGLRSKIAADIHADARGYVGGDSNGVQLAGSAHVGVGINVAF